MFQHRGDQRLVVNARVEADLFGGRFRRPERRARREVGSGEEADQLRFRYSITTGSVPEARTTASTFRDVPQSGL